MGGVAQAVDARRGYGQPLADRTREQVEPALQQDLSGVRVHTDDAADQLSQQFSAKAFTTGQDVFFRRGEYDPGSSSGDKLLAHELTHVVQQGNAPTKLAGKKMNVSEPGDAGEREADSVADAVMSPAGVSRREDEDVQSAAISREPTTPEEEELAAKRIDRQPAGEQEEEEVATQRIDRQPDPEEEGEEIVATKPIDRQPEGEREEELATKRVQRFEEDELQLAAVDRQPIEEEQEEEEEQPVQPKEVQRQDMLEEEPEG
jgi:hypothetical protein